MRTEFLKHFYKSVEKLRSEEVKNDVADSIENVESALKISDIQNLKKLKGFKKSYRIKIGDYRIGIFIDGDVVQFATVEHRKDIYKYFP